MSYHARFKNAIKPPKWTETYSHGTKEGDDELKFFILLSRNLKYVWRSTAAIAKETGLTKSRVEEIIEKYLNKGMIFQNPKNEDQWAYWERCPELLPQKAKTITEKDRASRMSRNRGEDACTKILFID